MNIDAETVIRRFFAIGVKSSERRNILPRHIATKQPRMDI